MAGARWVGVGAQVEEVLRGAYAAAIGRGSPAGTFDVLAYAATKPGLPLRLSKETGEALRLAAFGGGHACLRYGAGEVDVDAPPDSEVDQVLREVEWRVRRYAGRMAPVRVHQVEPWSDRPRWTPAARILVNDTLAEAWVRGATFAGLGHLLFAMLRAPDCDGTRYLASTGSRRARLLAFVTGAGGLDQTAVPYPDGLLADLETKADQRGVGAWFARLMVGLSTVDTAMGWARGDAKAQAVRLDQASPAPVTRCWACSGRTNASRRRACC